MDLNPDKRPTAAQLLGHPALASRAAMLPAQLAPAPPGTAQSALLDTIKVRPGWLAGRLAGLLAGLGACWAPE
jgi:hypothetical protein